MRGRPHCIWCAVMVGGSLPANGCLYQFGCWEQPALCRAPKCSCLWTLAWCAEGRCYRPGQIFRLGASYRSLYQCAHVFLPCTAGSKLQQLESGEAAAEAWCQLQGQRPVAARAAEVGRPACCLLLLGNLLSLAGMQAAHGYQAPLQQLRCAPSPDGGPCPHIGHGYDRLAALRGVWADCTLLSSLAPCLSAAPQRRPAPRLLLRCVRQERM